jgi:hypothetical protein
MKAQLQPKFGRKNGAAPAAGASAEEPDAPDGALTAAVPLVSELPPPPPIALDLAAAVPAGGRDDGQIVIKVEGMVQGAVLSAGRNNGNRTWSLATDQIAGLEYTLVHGPLIPHTLQVRVLAVAEDQATTLMLLETDIGTDGVATPLRLFAERRDDAAPAANGDDIETTAGLSRAITQSRQLARARIAAAKAAAAADEAGRHAAAAPDEIAILRDRMQALESELAAREREHADAAAAWDAERQAAIADLQAQVDTARADAEQAARSAAAHDFAIRERDAAAAWQREKELLLAEAQVRVEAATENGKPEKVRARVEATFDKERKKLRAEADRRVAEAAEAARTAAEAAAKQAAEAAHRDARAEAEERLTTARTEWDSERQASEAAAERRLSDAVGAARTAAEAHAAAVLAEARISWETETAARVAAAESAAESAAVETLAAARTAHAEECRAMAEAHESALAEAADSAAGRAQAGAEQALAAAQAAWRSERQTLETAIAASRAEAAAAAQRLNEAEAASRALQSEIERIQRQGAAETDHVLATRDIEMAALRTELESRIDAARRDGEAAGHAAVTQALSDDSDGVLAAARAEWEDELAGALARVRAETAAEAKAAQAGTLGAAVEAARAEWKAERLQTERAAQARLDAARSDAEAAHRALEEGQAAWEAEKQRLLADADARIAASGVADADSASAEAERRDAAVRAALADAERRWRRDLDIQVDAAEKRIAALRVAAETELEVERDKAVRTALAEARTRWECEFDQRLAEAEERWRAQEAKRIAVAQAEHEAELARRLEKVEAQHGRPAPSAAAAATVATGKSTAGKPVAPDPKLARTIAQWNRTHRRRKRMPLPHVPRRLALATICGAMIVGGGIYYQKGIDLWRKYAPVVDAEVAPHADEVTAQARQIAALVEAAIRERFPAAPPVAESDTRPGDDALDAILRHAWVKPEIANMRAEPSPDGALVATLARGIEVEQIEARGAWIHVRTRATNSQQGWMHASVLSSRAPQAAR